jgi:hypothetical protein
MTAAKVLDVRGVIRHPGDGSKRAEEPVAQPSFWPPRCAQGDTPSHFLLLTSYFPFLLEAVPLTSPAPWIRTTVPSGIP